MNYTNEASLRKDLINALQKASDEVILNVGVQNEKEIEQVVYSNSNNGYKRTGEFKKAWEADQEAVGDVGSSLDYEPNYITTIGGEPVFNYPHGGVHSSVLTGESSTGELVDYIYQGHGGIWSDPPRNAFKELDKWLNVGRVVKLFKQGMEYAGLKVKAGTAHKTKF